MLAWWNRRKIRRQAQCGRDHFGHVWYTYADHDKKLILRCERCGTIKITEGS